MATPTKDEMSFRLTTPTWLLASVGVLCSLVAAATIVALGGPSDRLTATWAFGLHALAAGVIAAEVIARILKRFNKRLRERRGE